MKREEQKKMDFSFFKRKAYAIIKLKKALTAERRKLCALHPIKYETLPS